MSVCRKLGVKRSKSLLFRQTQIICKKVTVSLKILCDSWLIVNMQKIYEDWLRHLRFFELVELWSVLHGPSISIIIIEISSKILFYLSPLWKFLRGSKRAKLRKIEHHDVITKYIFGKVQVSRARAFLMSTFICLHLSIMWKVNLIWIMSNVTSSCV